jgi:hypothetical protein
LITSISCEDHTSGNPHLFTVGVEGVIEIIEYRPKGEGDKWFYDVICEDGNNVRLFDFYSVGWKDD